jgi:hypothetical protein
MARYMVSQLTMHVVGINKIFVSDLNNLVALENL